MQQFATTTCINYTRLFPASGSVRDVIQVYDDNNSNVNWVNSATSTSLGDGFIAIPQNYKTVCVTETQIASSSSGGGIGYTGLNFQESLFIAGVIIFFLSFPFWSRLFSPIREMFNNENS